MENFQKTSFVEVAKLDLSFVASWQDFVKKKH
jgi:hypothetical protein